MSTLDKIKEDTLAFTLIGASLLFFVYKGVSYFLLGSYVPLIFIAIILALIGLSFKLKIKSQKRILKIWAIIIIIWGLGRLAVLLIFQIDSSLTESHIRDQLGFFQSLFSLLMALAGFLVLKRLKSWRI
ncbi:hypothetical protein N9B82_04035 [Saprospiraceae bacterium]|nr:hypothetical protein [Saprospiraceae bacterium]